LRVELPLPWERLLWKGRPCRFFTRLAGERYVLTDFRLARSAGDRIEELVLHDIAEVQRTESRLDRLLGTSTLIVFGRRRASAPLVLNGIRKGAQVAALIEFLSGDPSQRLDSDAVRAALAWTPRLPASGYGEALVGVLLLMATMITVVLGFNSKATPVIYAADDPIVPNGAKRDQREIVRFMEQVVMPWARVALAPIKGGAHRVTCLTCHGENAETRSWQMPGVAALPLSGVSQGGWEMYGSMDTQMRNAVYGYLAESNKQAKAAYMREIVMPGMAALLRRPAYDFTKPYDYNRSHHALGCYHCHRVK
jgi:hypothetical protein